MRNALLFLVLTAWTPSAFGVGLWTKSPGNLTLYSATRYFSPDFFLVKAAVFARNGTIKLEWPFESLLETCGKKFSTTAWVTHWLASGETLLPSGGKALAENINAQLLGTCFSSVELDIETLPQPPAWLAAYLTEVRRVLSQSYSLSIAIPVVSAHPPPGGAWSPEQANAVLGIIDGLDIMVYDTGSATDVEYGKLLAENLQYAAGVVKKNPKKQMTLGFPAYKEGNPKIHNVDVENLTIVKTVLKELPKDKARILCDGRVRVAYYPDWTDANEPRVDEKNKLAGKEIDKWLLGLCPAH